MKVPLNRARLPLLYGVAAFAAGCLTTGTGFLIWQRPNFDFQDFSSCHIGKAYAATQIDPLSAALPRTFNNVAEDSHSVSQQKNRPTPAFTASGPLPDAVMRVGLPSIEPIKIHPGFMLVYDRRTRVPRWVLEHLTPDRVNGDSKDVINRSKFEFFEDPSERQEFRSSNADYLRSGFDRGHMAPAGDNSFDSEAMQKSFILSNIAPQVGEGFNRHAWNSLEKYIRAMARRSANVVVISGPLFLPQLSTTGHRQVIYSVIGANNVAVPTHFFKAAAVQRQAGGEWKTYAWVMPNKELPKDVRVDSFIVPVKDLERAAGLELFPNIFKS